MKVNISLLKKLEKTIDTLNPEKGKIPIKVLGFGEISLNLEWHWDRLLKYKQIS